MRFTVDVIVAFALLGLNVAHAVPAPSPDSSEPSIASPVDDASYIVVMKPGVSESTFKKHNTWVDGLHKKNNAKISSRGDQRYAGRKHSYNMKNYMGYSGTFQPSTLKSIKADPNVAYVEKDQIMHAHSLVQQVSSPNWGLTRISHRNKGYSNYVFDSSAGTGTFAYVIDSGIRLTHVDFNGRAKFGVSFASDGTNNDTNGHGTHVAGIIGSRTYGVAKGTTLIAVKVLEPNGATATSRLITAINWVLNDAQTKNRVGKSVINMSIGGANTQALDDAVNKVVAAGIFFANSAGNSGADASTESPSRAASACAIGAIDKTDTKPSWSNFGPSVAMYAPGYQIISTFSTSDTAIVQGSGTSMSSPHVAGLAAYVLGRQSIAASSMCSYLKGIATGQVVGAGSTSDNLLPYNDDGQ